MVLASTRGLEAASLACTAGRLATRKCVGIWNPPRTSHYKSRQHVPALTVLLLDVSVFCSVRLINCSTNKVILVLFVFLFSKLPFKTPPHRKTSAPLLAPSSRACANQYTQLPSSFSHAKALFSLKTTERSLLVSYPVRDQ